MQSKRFVMSSDPRHTLPVEYVILAEFDIDRGVTVRHQYPRPAPLSPDVLGSLMLPDGGHKWESDCITYFMRVDNSAWLESASYRYDIERMKTENGIQAIVFSMADGEFTPLDGESEVSWVLFRNNIILIKNTKRTHRICLPGVVKAKPEGELFRSVQLKEGHSLGFRFAYEEAAASFDANINKIDPSSHQDNTALDDIFEEAQNCSNTQALDMNFPADGECILYCMCISKLVLDTSLRRGASLKSLGICSYFPFIHIYKDLIETCLAKYFDDPSEQILQDLFESINLMDFEFLQRLTNSQKRLVRGLWLADSKPDHQTLTVTLGGNTFKLDVPLNYYADEVGNPSVIKFIKKFPADFMTILNCLLMEKRILFVGNHSKVEDICNAVLSCILMVCPPLKNIIFRTFPYASLNFITTIGESTGFIAGVSNPMFQEKMELWDILCDISTSRVIFSPFFSDPNHIDFMEMPFVDSDKRMAEQVVTGIEANYGEARIRHMIQSYVRQILNVGTRAEYFGGSSEQRKFQEINKKRIEYIQKTQTYILYEIEIQKSKSNTQSSSKDLATDFRVISFQLKNQKESSQQQLLELYQQLYKAIDTDINLNEFLGTIPEIEGGLTYVATGLLHKNAEVRSLTTKIIKRISLSKSGKLLLVGLNFFLRSAYERQLTTLK